VLMLLFFKQNLNSIGLGSSAIVSYDVSSADTKSGQSSFTIFYTLTLSSLSSKDSDDVDSV